MRGSSSERTRHCSMANPARMAYTTWRKRAVQGMTILPSAEHAALRDGHPRAPQETIPRVSGAHLRAAMTERLGRVPPRAMTWHDLYLPTRTSACKARGAACGNSGQNSGSVPASRSCGSMWFQGSRREANKSRHTLYRQATTTRHIRYKIACTHDVERDKEEGARGDSGVTGSSSVPEYRALRVRERGMPHESTRRHAVASTSGIHKLLSWTSF